jgi:hypothetical protein
MESMSSVYIDVPNLELLIYKAEQVLRRSKSFQIAYKAKYGEELKNGSHMDLVADCFLQMWGSTALGFDETVNGIPSCGCDAMTEAYTTVVHERMLDFYVVFFDGKMCYMVDEPTDQFVKDLQMRNLRSLHDALRLY